MLLEDAEDYLSGGIHTGMLPEGECEMYSLSTPRNILVMNDIVLSVAFASKDHCGVQCHFGIRMVAEQRCS
jgi:hypothetical protein